MTGRLAHLVEQIKTNTISREDAAVQLKAIVAGRGVAGAAPETVAPQSLPELASRYFVNLFSGALQIAPADLDPNAPMDEFGIDSFLVLELTTVLEGVFGTLSKTLFFEYQSIAALAEYFVHNHRAALLAQLDLDATLAATPSPVPHAPAHAAPPPAAAERDLVAGAVPRSRRRAGAPASTTESGSAAAVSRRDQDIAIVGLAGRYPQADDVAQFWANVRDGRDCVTEIPASRWDHERYADGDPGQSGKIHGKWGGFIDAVDCFDPLFFNISPREAERMDPQERLFLECAYGVLEDAGYTRAALARQADLGLDGQVGVYVGVMGEEYHLYGVQAQVLGTPLALAGTTASIANRVSFFCNFHGPSLAIDTMCSSSLTAIHLACQALHRGDCAVALAGGVNLSIHPNKYLMLSQGKFISANGRCESFGEGGEGYVPGEGVGAVLLKPLARAVADGDHVYGVIKSSAINHGGKTNGYSVPNPHLQAKVVERALRDAGIDARMVSYIEAHGTGTTLGDPIEIAGLTKAFDHWTAERQFCAIGSAKSNIGHCESAAGIAGLTKVLMQMKHGQIAPSLHSRVLNRNIDFANTPFVVQQELTEWQRPTVNVNGQSRQMPRIAGISSFGAGGANAHLVVAEYVAPVRPAPTPTPAPALVVLSARDPARLQQQVQRLLACLQTPPAQLRLDDLAYTLQLGREAMEERLAIVAGSLDELAAKLIRVAAGEGAIDGVARGKAQRQTQAAAMLTPNAVDASLAARWVEGAAVEWTGLYGAGQARRISLPAYPFAREPYWVGGATGVLHTLPRPADLAGAARLHPLLQRNTSDLAGLRFSTTLTGREFFLADHRVNGSCVLPGVAQLEMALCGAAAVSGRDGPFELRYVGWLRPVTVGEQALELHLELSALDNGDLAYEIVSQSGEIALAYGRGVIVARMPEEAPALDVALLRAQCQRTHWDAEYCYARFVQLGMSYGPAQRGLRDIYLGHGQVLARLALPQVVAATQDSYRLHPSLLDAALQATLGMGSDSPAALMLPFALDGLHVHAPCAPQMWAWVRHSAGSAAGAPVQKFDIDLCDDLGKVCVQLRQFSMRLLETETAKPPVLGTVLLQPEWRPAGAGNSRQSCDHHVIVLAGADPATLERVQQHFGTSQCMALPIDGELAHSYVDAACQVLLALQACATQAGSTLVQLLVPSEGPNQVFAGLEGMLRSAALEHPRLACQLICADEAQDVVALLEENRRSEALSVRYQAGVRQERHFTPLGDAPLAARPWRDQGVYLITGGSGGLGMIFAQEIAAQAKQPVLVLTGRSVLNAAQRPAIAALEAQGARVDFRQADVGDPAAVARLVRAIERDHGKLNGVLHSAGILRDSLVANKSEQQLRDVLHAKVAGLLHLDWETRTHGLDFLVCFSSLSSVFGNLGQADYAAANGFMDAYVRHRAVLVARGERFGRSLSLNWPLWRDGGMQIDAARVAQMTVATGLVPMSTASGLAALARALSSTAPQVLVAEGEIDRLHTSLAGIAAPAPAAAATTVSAPSSALAGQQHDGLEDKTRHYLSQMLAGVLKLPSEKIDVHASLEEFGIDSILVMELTVALEQVFGSLSKTLFFEYRTIAALAGYFMQEQRAALVTLFGAGAAVAGAQSDPAVAMPITAPPLAPAARRQRRGWQAPPASPAAVDEIAIIGLAGRYPQAHDVGAFWDNLREGRDCVTDIPAERWDQRGAAASGKVAGKRGGFIDGVDRFDPLFFNISPRDAALMDPQERLFLECVYATLEDAGYTREALASQTNLGLEGNVGVYVGVMYEEYQLYGAQEQARGHALALVGSPASIANRVSYFCNFHGPSMALDTMCSSSLTAIHLACEALRHGGCALAIAGGVNVSIHPNKYLLLGQGNFISGKGRCESFGEGGEGYVPSEGVGALLLKPKAQAIADGDHIYGVIKASAINHGGKTNGYTVPNPQAQAQVVERALREAGVNARAISYLEAHGTGTTLGDPIEIAGLSKAFEHWSHDRQFCAIGSAKSNIGHCESAAGIAGVTKVLLQMKHRMLVPSLHSRALNPHIDFGTSPFVVQQELAEWKRPMLVSDGVAREHLRLAGISSFGAGGANAHLVIEEYEATAVAAPEGSALIVLSARNPARLQERVRLLHEAISRDASMPLADLAYTLQVGREAMEERIALIVDSVAQLRERLADIIAGKTDGYEVFRGQVARNKETMALFAMDDDMAATLRAWIAKGKYGKLLELWVKGLALDWNALYGARRPRRISLPTYPFAGERYWVPTAPASAMRLPADAHQGGAHHLPYRNTSDLTGLRYSVLLSGEEFFLNDHRVLGQRVLPGVVQLEMALATASLVHTGVAARRLTNVAWLRPIVVEGAPLLLHIGLFPEAGGAIAFEIYSDADDGDAGAIVLYSQGVVAPAASARAAPAWDLAALGEQCQRTQWTAQQCYAAFDQAGLAYGPAQQSLASLSAGNGLALARLVLPATVAGTEGDYVLHPSMLDGALQACAGMQEHSGARFLPFALGELESLQACSARMWARVSRSPGCAAGDALQKFDIDLCDEHGAVCVRLRQFSLRLQQDVLRTAPLAVAPAPQTFLLHPLWRAQGTETDGPAPAYDRHLVVVCGMDGGAPPELQEQLAGAQVLWIEGGAALADAYASCAQQLLEQIARIAGLPGWSLIQVVVPAQRPGFAGLGAMLLCAKREHHRITGQLIAINDVQGLGEVVLENYGAGEQHIRYRAAGRELRQLVEWQAAAGQAPATPWKEQGVYLITGGLGGLGLIFARAIAGAVSAPTLILTGRSAMSGEGLLAVRSLEALGATVCYHAVDVADAQAMTALVQSIPEQHTSLDGIIHSAGVVRDSVIVKKTAQQLHEVMQAKVAGLVNLDQASADMALDFFICFSSAAALFGNPGQADYAAANAFMDAFVLERADLVAQGRRRGASLSLNWSLWDEGGMQLSAPARQALARQTGTLPLATAQGVAALALALTSGLAQVAVVAGDGRRMREALLGATPAVQAAASTQTGAPVDSGGLEQQLQFMLVGMISTLLKVSPEDVDVDAQLNEYGFDSVTLTEFGTILYQRLQIELAPTVFFEFPTIRRFGAYLVQEHGASLAAQIGTRADPAPAPDAPVAVDGDSLSRTELRKSLTAILSTVLKVKPDEVDGDAELGEYGFDSITLTEFGTALHRQYQIEIAPTMFFEYPTLNGLADYLLLEHRDALCTRAAPAVSATPWSPSPAALAAPVAPAQPRTRRRAAAVLDAPAATPVPNPAPEPVAIIGMSGRFPMAVDLDAYWQNLLAGRDCISEIPTERWDWQAVFGDPAREVNRTNIKWGGFIDGVDQFDPLFFGISPKEAVLMDPQQRLLMMYVWKALEDAGYAGASLAGSDSALFVATGASGYAGLAAASGQAIEAYSATGAVASVGPNRMSYFLNWHGASEPVETACSSSLVAMHRGVQAITSGESTVAVVGGISTIITPDLHISFSKAGMLSEDGRCKTFSAQADGYVRGEGVGMLVLKRLSAAERDGDHIYGVVRATAENHGGRANSLTAPNPNAQAALLKTAYRKAGIDPASVGFIEAHGTGTSLGDPIEINALKAAFRELAADSANTPAAAAHCGLGSAKSNVGHLELAAGIAGVIKVLLQMKHKTLVKSLHCDELNPYIDLANSPFYIVQEQRPWEALRDVSGVPLPRRAGVSSFGFGGVNAHVVLEEYVAPPARALPAGPAMVVLSARDDARLREQVQLLHAALTRGCDGVTLADLAYTLQVGREEMEVRLGLVAVSLADLQAKLAEVLAGKDGREVVRGHVKRNKQSLALFTADEDMARAIDAWVAKGKYGKLLDLWSKGLVFDWQRLYGAVKPCRVSLPSYPFARERYWVEPGRAVRPGALRQGQALMVEALHPLVHRNASDFAGVRFSTMLTGDEFFLADHQVQGVCILPGVAQLEMARCAASLASGHEGALHLRDVRWLRPAAASAQGLALHVLLAPLDDGAFAYHIVGDGDAGARTLYGDGVLYRAMPARTVHDVPALRAQCTLEHWSGAQCYALFDQAGLQYGAAMRGIEALYRSDQHALARLALPDCVSAGEDAFVLHPSLLDAALQSALGLQTGAVQGATMMPFALGGLDLLGPCKDARWALARYSADSVADDGVARIDVDLCNDDGTVCVRFRQLCVRAVRAAVPQPTALLVPGWDVVQPALASASAHANVLVLGGDPAQQQVLLAQFAGARFLALPAAADSVTLARLLREQGALDHLVWLPDDQDGDDDLLVEAQQSGAVLGFRLIKALLGAGYGQRALEWTVITRQTQAVRAGEAIRPAHAAIHGLIGAMAKEYRHWAVRLVDMPAAQDSGRWPWSELVRLPTDAKGDALAYRDREWYRAQLVAAEFAKPVQSGQAYRAGGVYVVIGGAGGIGQAWSQHMISAHQANIVWIGRRPHDAVIAAAQQRLAAFGPAPLYLSADATRRGAMEDALAQVMARFGTVHGVVHAALVLDDKSLAQMEEQAFCAALAAKVDVGVRLVQVFASLPLDFMLFFSSMQSFSKAAGQANYAAACTFKDAYALALAQRLPYPVKVINWAYWGSVGVVASAAYRDRMAALGIGSIEPDEGWRALDTLFAAPLPQLAFVKASRADGIASFAGPSRIKIQAAQIASTIKHMRSNLLAASGAPAALATTPIEASGVK